MDSSSEFTIAGRSWSLHRSRASGGGKIYKSIDGSSYLRTDSPKSIRDEVTFAKELHHLNFPVPKVEESGELKDEAYFIENSLGNETFGATFRREFKESGIVSDETFRQYCLISKDFLEAQLKSAKKFVGSKNDMRKSIHVDTVLDENPDLNSHFVLQAVDKAIARTADLPSVLTHGDLNPFNILQKGVIDFEHSFIAPAGYDVIGNIFYGRFWNFRDELGEQKLSYDFADKQVKAYLYAVDKIAEKHNIEKLSDFIDDFLLLKSIWSLCHEKKLAHASGSYNKWHFRKAVLLYCLEQYSTEKPIDTKAFSVLKYS